MVTFLPDKHRQDLFIEDIICPEYNLRIRFDKTHKGGELCDPMKEIFRAIQKAFYISSQIKCVFSYLDWSISAHEYVLAADAILLLSGSGLIKE